MSQHSQSLTLLLDCLGHADAVRMVQALGGTKWRVPASGCLPDGHAWAEVLGGEKAGALAAYLAGEADVRIPRDRGIIDALIAEAKQQGKSHNELAVMFGKDVRNIIKALQRHREAERREALAQAQHDLFR